MDEGNYSAVFCIFIVSLFIHGLDTPICSVKGEYFLTNQSH